jgi:hypothetical protein
VVDPFLSVALIVLSCTSSLKVAVTKLATGTPVAFDAGLSAVTVGGVVTAGPAVVNDQVNGLGIRWPPLSVTPLTVAVYVVEAASAANGVRVATFDKLL